MAKEAKTNAMRMLERAKVNYTAHEYSHEEGQAVDGANVARLTGQDPARVFNKVTGYIRGGCSPVGMKKQFVTVYDESCLAQPTIMVSGGRIGTQVECAPADLIKVTRGKTAAITQEHQA